MSWAIRTQIPRYMQPRPPLIPFTIPRVMFPLFTLIPPRIMVNVRSNTRVEVLQGQYILVLRNSRGSHRILRVILIPSRPLRWIRGRRFRRSPLGDRLIRGLFLPTAEFCKARAHRSFQPLISRSQCRNTSRGDAEEDFPGSPVPVGDTGPSRVAGLVLPVQDCADDGERAGDDAKTHKGAETEFAAEGDLDFTEDQDGEGGEKEV